MIELRQPTADGLPADDDDDNNQPSNNSGHHQTASPTSTRTANNTAITTARYATVALIAAAAHPSALCRPTEDCHAADAPAHAPTFTTGATSAPPSPTQSRRRSVVNNNAHQMRCCHCDASAAAAVRAAIAAGGGETETHTARMSRSPAIRPEFLLHTVATVKLRTLALAAGPAGALAVRVCTMTPGDRAKAVTRTAADGVDNGGAGGGGGGGDDSGRSRTAGGRSMIRYGLLMLIPLTAMAAVLFCKCHNGSGSGSTRGDRTEV